MPVSTKKSVRTVTPFPESERRTRNSILDDPLDYNEVASLAHSYWESRGNADGSPEDDWYRAEAELRRRKVEMQSSAA